MAPEVIKQEQISSASDIWSVACTIIEMASGIPPWSEQFPDPVTAMWNIAKSSKGPPLPTSLSPEAHIFLASCFQRYVVFYKLLTPTVTIAAQTSARAHQLYYNSLGWSMPTTPMKMCPFKISLATYLPRPLWCTDGNISTPKRSFFFPRNSDTSQVKSHVSNLCYQHVVPNSPI